VDDSRQMINPSELTSDDTTTLARAAALDAAWQQPAPVNGRPAQLTRKDT
jgi:hypothetical protein